jgi:exodeoxyribonuclease X
MSQAMILDTELTGLHEPDVIQLAAKGPMEFESWHEAPVQVLHFKPRKPITPGAMAVHRIIPEDLEAYPAWQGWHLLPNGVQYVIGHGVDIDWTAIGAPHNVRRICTLALAKRYWPDLDSYKLVALIYHLISPATARDLTTNAHNAAVDINLTEFILDNLIQEINTARGGVHPHVQSWETLWEISEAARIPLRIGFSKYGPKNGQPGTLYSEVPVGMLRWICDPVRINEMDPWEVKAAQQQLAIRG